MVRAEPVDEHVGTALHLQRDLELSQLGLGDGPFILPHKEGLLGRTIATLLNLFAYRSPREQLVSHLHAIHALVWVGVLSLVIRPIAEERRELGLEALLAQLNLLLLHQILHRLVNPVQFVIFSDHHER